MKVELDPALMNQPELFGRTLNAIVDIFIEGRHQWLIRDPDVVIESRWVLEAANWDSSLRDLVEKTFRTAVDEVDCSSSKWPHLLVTLREADHMAAAAGPQLRSVSPESAKRILAEPAYVVLENATSDWFFLKAMARTFERSSLISAMENAWLCPENAGGGGEFLKRIAALIKRGIVEWRILALTDSDRMKPGELPRKVAAMVQKIEALGVKVFVLYKREIENYLPDIALDSRKHHDAFVSLIALTREQRDYFDMKNGFARDRATGEPIIDPDQQDLFAKTNPWHLRRLIGGFGEKIADQFRSVEIDLESMAAVCETCPGEIERVLDALEEVL